MDFVLQFVSPIHRIFGQEFLGTVIIAVAIYLTVTYKPNAPRSPVARLLPVLIDLQVGLGILYWIALIVVTSGALRAQYLGFPFLLHPILGVVAAGFAHMALGERNPLRSLGRWAPMASLGVLLLVVLSNILIARLVPA